MPRFKNVKGVRTQFTAEEEAAFDATNEAAIKANALVQYKYDRIAAYGNIGDQLDLLFHDMTAGKGNKDGEWYKAIKAVKDANGKPG